MVVIVSPRCNIISTLLHLGEILCRNYQEKIIYYSFFIYKYRSNPLFFPKFNARISINIDKLLQCPLVSNRLYLSLS